ncbi:MAG: hypothetical protein NVS1B14_09430 [Vulcanimicrobiaceae bacterium]
MHTVYIGLGSNLGDRQSNILTALQRLRARAVVVATSSFYETRPAGGAQGPDFLNAAAELQTSLDRAAFERFAAEVERAVGRTAVQKLAARLIDIDVLAVDCAYEHPQLGSRPFNLVPLGEIASAYAGRAALVPLEGIRKKTRALHFEANRQEEAPAVRISLSRVGVSNVRRIVHLRIDDAAHTYNGTFTMVADLAPDKAGVHMSRFNEILEETALEVLARQGEPARIQALVEAIAREIVQAHDAVRADVRLRADFGLERWTPVSGKRGEETYTLVGIAHADRRGSRVAIGVEAEGMTACPCAQAMIREQSFRELQAAGFSEADAHRALDALPVATHNQRGRGTVLIGTNGPAHSDVRAADLVELVENAMSSETYDLLKRPDEFFIVNKAHHNPKFVEDVVRGIVAGTLEMYPDFPADTFLAATQTNYESIHKHDAFAETFGTFEEFRNELHSGRPVAEKTDLAGWLRAREGV